MEVGTLNKKDLFYHKNCTYEVLEVDYIFVIAKKLKDDGVKHYFLSSINVHKADITKDWTWENPNHHINDLYKNNK